MKNEVSRGGRGEGFTLWPGTSNNTRGREGRTTPWSLAVLQRVQTRLVKSGKAPGAVKGGMCDAEGDQRARDALGRGGSGRQEPKKESWTKQAGERKELTKEVGGEPEPRAEEEEEEEKGWSLAGPWPVEEEDLRRRRMTVGSGG